jgi:hypothetical protein
MSELRATDEARVVVLQRFCELPRKDQLEVYAFVRDYLAEGNELAKTKKDERLEEQRDALEALAAVASACGVPDGKAPTTTQFDDLAPTAAPGWTKSRVIRAFGRWRIAREIYERETLRPTWRQQELERERISRQSRHEAHLTSLKIFVESKPARADWPSFVSFREHYNDHLQPGQRPLATPTAIVKSLGWSFDEAIRVAKREIEPEEAKPHKPQPLPRLDDEEGPHGLVCARVAAGICGYGEVSWGHQVIHHPDFPTPVIALDHLRLWYRSDVEAFAAGREFPRRAYNELRTAYLTVGDLVELTGKARGAVPKLRGLPAPAVIAGRQRLYLKDEVETALPTIRSFFKQRRSFVPKKGSS